MEIFSSSKPKRAIEKTKGVPNSVYFLLVDIDGLVQGCSISSVLAIEILQSCTKPSMRSDTTTAYKYFHHDLKRLFYLSEYPSIVS